MPFFRSTFSQLKTIAIVTVRLFFALGTFCPKKKHKTLLFFFSEKETIRFILKEILKRKYNAINGINKPHRTTIYLYVEIKITELFEENIISKVITTAN